MSKNKKEVKITKIICVTQEKDILSRDELSKNYPSALDWIFVFSNDKGLCVLEHNLHGQFVVITENCPDFSNRIKKINKKNVVICYTKKLPEVITEFDSFVEKTNLLNDLPILINRVKLFEK